MTTEKKYSIGGDRRLKSRKKTELLFATGRRINSFPLKLVYLAEQGGSDFQVGFSVGKKNFPRAVDRNRIKRLMRECFRLQIASLEEISKNNGFQLSVFILYISNELPTYETLFAVMAKILKKTMVSVEKDVQ